MALVHDGDARAFEVVFDRHGDAAFSFAYRMCGRRAMAEDVVQDAFLSLWRGGGRYNPARGSVRLWVLSVVRHRAIDAFRREDVRTSHNITDEGFAESLAACDCTDVEVERREDAAEVRAALSTLPADQRQVIELAYFGGFTHSQIADMLSLPSGTVKGRMRLGLTKLRISLRGPAEALL